MKHYAVIYEKTKTGYSAHVPDLPGCITTGATREETERLMKEAIKLHLAGMREDGPSPLANDDSGHGASRARSGLVPR
ncbi:MAG TPA: type II toxin-antitoxin system HicB family antitoxin [Bryobacteraceae bacterium]|nr:type II toxin-antitoxin system HicB family antitoxin [Bryobacteraceae bacterium]